MTPIAIGIAVTLVAVLLAALVSRIAEAGDSAFEQALSPEVEHPPAEQRASLIAARRVVVNATAPRSLHLRARPVLVELTEARLRERHGIGLDTPRAGEIVREPLWSIVRPDARSPDHDDPALTPQQLSTVLDRLEAL